MDETLIKALSFPGADLFDTKSVARLGGVIKEVREFKPQAVNAICEDMGIGWDESGYPQTSEISRVEELVKTRGCAAIALETARALGGELTAEQIIGIVDASGRVYENIPQAVYQALQQSA